MLHFNQGLLPILIDICINYMHADLERRSNEILDERFNRPSHLLAMSERMQVVLQKWAFAFVIYLEYIILTQEVENT